MAKQQVRKVIRLSGATLVQANREVNPTVA
jgi:hypothetical protein